MDLEKSYLFISILTAGVTTVIAICFLLLSIPESASLKSYKTARKVMFWAYLILSVMNIVEILTKGEQVDRPFNLTIYLTVSAFQAFLFAYTFICLINIRFVTKKKILNEVLPLIILTIAIFSVYFIDSQSIYFKIIYFTFLAYYISLLIRYTIVFIKEYNAYTLRSDNYFSEKETKRFRWILYSFFSALVIGIGTIVLALTDNYLYYNIIAISILLFYGYFGIKFIDYAVRFQYMEPLVIPEENPVNIEVNTDKHPQHLHLNKMICKWIESEMFLKTGLTIEQASRDLNTNRTYLSNYINSSEQKNFREWINFLRIQKSKEILLTKPELSIYEVAEQSGYSDSSNFNKQFVKSTGISAYNWRKQNIKL